MEQIKTDNFNTKSVMNFYQLFYVLMIVILTLVIGKISIFTFSILLILAIPFLINLERLIEIAYILSLLPYYLLGADEAIFSIYSILMVMLLITAFMKKKFYVKHLFQFLIMILIIPLSYFNSDIQYENGLRALIYLVFFTIVITITYKIDNIKPLARLPYISCLLLTFLGIHILVSPFIILGRYTLSSSLNPNTFGMASAQLGIVLMYSIKSTRNLIDKLFFSIFISLAFLLSFLSGSRSSLLALILSFLIFFILLGARNRKILLYLFYSSIFILITFLISYIFIQINLFNLDISRLSISSIIDSGGTNRIFLWENVINNVINNKPFLGYGPGHPTSSELIFSLIHRTYSHTHNTLIEAFTELGLLGLLFFSIILINAFKSAYDKAKNNQNYYVVLGIFIGILINGIGESYFVSATQWIVIALAISSYKNTIHNEAYIET